MRAETAGEERALGFVRIVRDFSPTLLQLLGAILLALFSVLPSGLEWLFVVPGILAAAAGAVLALVRKPTREQLRESIRGLRARTTALEDRIRAYEAPSSERVTFLLRRLLRDLDLGGPHHRASIFIRMSETDQRWRLIARYSADADLTRAGRSTYGPDQGLVAETWRRGQSHIADLPVRRPAWNKAVCATFNMSLDEVTKLRMQSRSYGCVRIDRSQGAIDVPVGVLIVESIEPNGIEPRMVDAMLAYDSLPLLAAECAFHRDLGTRDPNP